MILAMTITSFAAFGVKLQFTDPSATVGESFNVTMKLKAEGGDLGSAKVMIKYDPAYLEFVSGDYAEGGAGTIKVTGDTTLGKAEWAYSLKFKALAPGSTSITVDKDSLEVYDDSQNMASMDHVGSSTVTIAGEEGSSVNANLSSLKISPGVLTPEFSPEITEYTALVGGECTKVAVSAPTADSNAKVIISGNADLQLGENTITCEVTAQDGSSSRTYTIVVTKQEGEVDYGEAAVGGLQATVNGTDYEVAETFDETILPEGFISQTVNYKGQSVLAGVNQTTGLTLMYLIGGDGSGDLFIYNAASDQWSPYAVINTTEKSITVVPMGNDVQVPEGFGETTLELNGKKVHGWIWTADLNQEYCMVYGMNADGETGFYRYDMKEKTIQRFFSNPTAVDSTADDQYVEAATKYNELIKDYNLRGYIMIGLGIIAAILLIALIVVIITSRGSGSKERMTEDSVEIAKARRAQEREARRKAREEYDYSDEERYMRGDESQVYEERPVRNQVEPESRVSEPTREAQLQQKLAQSVRDTEIVEESKNDDTDDFDVFEI